MIYNGISSDDAKKLYEVYGPNELEPEKKISVLKLFIEAFKEPMLLILFSACILYLIIGDKTDFGILTASAFVILTINVTQSYKTSKEIEKLKSLTKKYTEVFRDGKKVIIESRYLVPTDYAIVSEGDRIPADLSIIDQSNLTIDEAILTGESLPVLKESVPEFFDYKSKKSDIISKNIAYSGTLVTSGWLIGIVKSTGINTKIGVLGNKLRNIEEQEPQVKLEISKIVKILAIICIFTCIVVWTLNYLYSGNFITSSIYTISLAIALVPEELPIVLTVFLALSSLRLSKKGLIVKNKAIVETLGATNVICIDKTGTLTKNELKLKKIILEDKVSEINQLELSDKAINLIKASFLASYFSSKDTIDKEISEIFKVLDIDTNSYKPIAEAVLQDKFVFSKSYEYRNKEAIFIKGAYEQVSKHCRISEKFEDYYLSNMHELSNQGYRLIAVAEKITSREDSNKKYSLLGILAFQDEIREESFEYVKFCQDNQIRICMITGDHKNTASYVALKVGIKNPDNILTGDEIEKLDLKTFINRIKITNVYARITPEQKLKIIKALMKDNIVAMTGDGVNDALALKTANVGLSIGKGGTDVAFETSDIILIENNLKNILEGIIEGRRIYQNLAITARYIFSFHIPIVFLALCGTFLQLPILLLPIHIAILEFIIDPFSTVVFESIPAQKNLLSQKPRSIKFKLVQNMDIKLGLIYGVAIFLLVFLPFYYFNVVESDFLRASTVSMFSFLILNIWLIIFNFSTNLSFYESFKNKNLIFSLIALSLAIFFIYQFRYSLSFLNINYNLNFIDFSIIFVQNLIFVVLGLIFRIPKFKVKYEHEVGF
jgi:Ca2+-transporting ATPase